MQNNALSCLRHALLSASIITMSGNWRFDIFTSFFTVIETDFSIARAQQILTKQTQSLVHFRANMNEIVLHVKKNVLLPWGSLHFRSVVMIVNVIHIIWIVSYRKLILFYNLSGPQQLSVVSLHCLITYISLLNLFFSFFFDMQRRNQVHRTEGSKTLNRWWFNANFTNFLSFSECSYFSS